MTITKKLTRNTGFVLISGIINKIVSLFFIAYAARVLGPGNFGLYALIGSVTFIFFYFGNFGIGPMAIRELSRDKKKVEELFNHILSLRVSLVVLAYPLLVLVVNLLGYKEDIKYLIYITGLTAICSTFSGTFRTLYMAFERFKVPSVISVLVSFLSTVSNIIVLYHGYGLKGIIWISFIGTLLGAIISGVWIRRRVIKYRFTINLSTWKALISQSIPFAVLSFLQQANNQMNILLLSRLPGPIPGDVAMGYFNPSSAVGKLAMMFPNSFKQAALPTISSNSENHKVIEGIIDKSTKLLLVMIIFPLILATTFFPKEIIAIIFGSEYLPAAPALTLLGWGYALHVFNSPVSVTLSASREINRFIPWAVLILVINFIFAVPLILYYSFVGAAIAFLISKVVETFFRSYLLESICGIRRVDIKEFSKVLIPMIIIFVVILLAYLNSLSPIKLLILILVLYSSYIFYSKDLRQGIAILSNGLIGRISARKRIDGKE